MMGFASLNPSYEDCKARPPMTDTHEIYAIRYGHHPRRSPANFIDGDPHDVLQPLDFFVWAIKGPSGVIVVDTGFDAAMAARRQRQMVKPVGEGLLALGIAPETVETVIVSHLHYDHCGNYDLFPRARAITCRIARWPTRPGAACATRRCACRSRRRTWWRW
jgi:glyoxylase-like metal-dependent hydrolase (beta-lactamase superfamily II)